MKTGIQQRISNSRKELKERWAEYLLQIAGGFLFFGGLMTPFICVVPYASPQIMKRDMILSTIGYVAFGVALLIWAKILTWRRQRKEAEQGH